MSAILWPVKVIRQSKKLSGLRISRKYAWLQNLSLRRRSNNANDASRYPARRNQTLGSDCYVRSRNNHLSH